MCSSKKFDKDTWKSTLEIVDLKKKECGGAIYDTRPLLKKLSHFPKPVPLENLTAFIAKESVMNDYDGCFMEVEKKVENGKIMFCDDSLLVSADYVFDIEIQGGTYAHLWGGNWFFGENEDEDPRGRKFFLNSKKEGFALDDVTLETPLLCGVTQKWIIYTDGHMLKCKIGYLNNDLRYLLDDLNEGRMLYYLQGRFFINGMLWSGSL